MALAFDHIHLLSEDPAAAAAWYERVLGGSIVASYELRGAPQINVRVADMQLIIRGRRPGEEPATPRPMQDFADYSSHNEWGTDHFGFTYRGDLRAYCEQLCAKGASFSVAPWEFTPGTLICYLAAPDGVSIELVQGKA